MKGKLLLIISYILLHATWIHAQTISTTYDNTCGVSHWIVSDILQDKYGFIWFSTWNGLNRFDGYEFIQVKATPGDGTDITSSVIRQIWTDKDGNIVCATNDGQFLLNTTTYKLSSVSAVKPARQHGSLHDREGNTWSVMRYGVTKTSTIHHPASIVSGTENVQARAFLADNSNRWWLATKEDRCIRIYDARNSLLGFLGRDGIIHKQKTPFGESAYCITQMRNGDVWIGCKPGALYRLRLNTDGTYSVNRIQPDGLTCDIIYDMAEDSHGRLWLATFGGGLQCIVTPQAEHPSCVNFTKQRAFCHEAARVRRLALTHNGLVVCATNGGLVVGRISHHDVSATSFFRLTRDGRREASLCNNFTMAVVRDRKGNIFIATENDGIDMIHEDSLTCAAPRFRHFNTRNSSITSNACIAMTLKDNGSILVVCTDRVMDFMPYKDHTVTYSRKFWNEQCHFSEEHPLILPDGSVLIGSEQGAYIATRHNMETRGYIPPLVFTKLLINHGDELFGVCSHDSIMLNADERSFTLHFATLDFTDNSGILYRTRLNNDAWSMASSQRSLTFYNLPPGTYTLQVQSTDRYGRWIPNTRSLTIIVAPFWYETTWARLLALLAVIAIVTAIVYTFFHIRHLHRQRSELLSKYMEMLNRDSHAVETSRHTPANHEALPASLRPDDQWFLNKVREFIEQNIANSDATIDDMAAFAATSRSNLNRKLRSLVGITAAQLLINARMQHASQLLQSCDASHPLSLAQLASRCGYSDPHYFARQYRQRYGVNLVKQNRKQ